jgi:HEAT repeat protein
MDCDFAKISMYVDHQLSETEAREVESHLKTCSQCASYLEHLTSSLSYLKRFGRIELPQDFSARLSWRLEHEVSRRLTRSVRLRAVKRAAVYAAVAAGVLIMVLLFLPEARTPAPARTEIVSEKKIEPAMPETVTEQTPEVVSPEEGVVRVPEEKREPAPEGVVHFEPEHPLYKQPEEKSPAVAERPQEPRPVTPERIETGPAVTISEARRPLVPPVDAAAEVEKLEKLLANGIANESNGILIQIIRNLGSLDTPKSYALLQKVLSPQSGFDKELRKEALFSLTSLGTKDAARIVLMSFSDEDWEVRDSVPLALSQVEKEETIHYLAAEALPSTRLQEPARAGVAWALGRTKAEVPTELLAAAFRNEKNSKVRYAICEALGRRREPGVEAALISALSDSTWYVRDIAIVGLGQVGTSDSVEKIIPFLHDSNSLVRESAAYALSRIPDMRSLAPLVKALHTKDKRFYGSVLTSLVRITGKEFATESEWKKWLKSAGENPEIPPNPQAKVPASSYFLGLPLHTGRVIFLIDCSLSMEQTGKLQEAKDELKKTIQNLDSDVLFNIMFFGSTQQYFSTQQFAPASDENKRTAAKFIDAVRPDIGGKNLYDILAKCLSFEPDDIFILTSGMPSEGRYIDASKIVLEISKGNAFQKTRISTIGFFSGKNTDPTRILIPVGSIVDLLRGLAEENYGTFIYRWFRPGESRYSR